jgi:hypothetical protein
MAWKLRTLRNLQRRTLAEFSGAYAPHVTEYFALDERKRELPARHIAAVEAVLGNTVISQYVAMHSQRTFDELHALRSAA